MKKVLFAVCVALSLTACMSDEGAGLRAPPGYCGPPEGPFVWCGEDDGGGIGGGGGGGEGGGGGGGYSGDPCGEAQSCRNGCFCSGGYWRVGQGAPVVCTSTIAAVGQCSA